MMLGIGARKSGVSSSLTAPPQTFNPLLQHLSSRLFRRNRLTSHQLYSRPETFRKVAQRRPAAVAEKAAPKSSQRHGHNCYGPSLDDNFNPVFKGAHFAVRCEPAFREYTHHITSIQLFVDAVESCLVNLRYFGFGTDGDGFGKPE